jgi:hypothetical protein
MEGSRQRVRQVVTGQKPDRIPLFDLIPNDVVLHHFNAGNPVAPGDDRAGIRALTAATDATRFSYFSPMAPKTETLPDGRTREYHPWTIWTSHRHFSSSEEYRQIKTGELARSSHDAETPLQFAQDEFYQKHRELFNVFGENYYFILYAPSPGLMGLYEEVGLEAFSYFLCDCEEIVISQLEQNTNYACRWALSLPADDPFEMVFIGEDIAFNHGPMVSPAWLKRHYFPRLRRVIDTFHAHGKKVMFHSDGNLNLIMDDLVEAGIDVLNPIEVAAGMNLADLHHRYPNLIFAGGIDVSALLPLGTPQQVKTAIVKAIEDTEGKILIGSSTEVMNNVPLINFLTMRETALNYH